MSRLGLALAVVALLAAVAVWLTVRAVWHRPQVDSGPFTHCPETTCVLHIAGDATSTAPAWTTSDGGRTWQPWWLEEAR